MTEIQFKESFEDCAEWSYFLGGQGWSFQKSTGLCKVTRNTTKIESHSDWISGTERCYKGEISINFTVAKVTREVHMSVVVCSSIINQNPKTA